MKNPSLLNKSAVKKRALYWSTMMRGGKFTRVSQAFLDRLEIKLEETLASWIHSHPSVGKTLQ